MCECVWGEVSMLMESHNGRVVTDRRGVSTNKHYSYCIILNSLMAIYFGCRDMQNKIKRDYTRRVAMVNRHVFLII